MTCRDHSVSKEEFQLLYDETYDMLVTYPRPSSEALPKYYDSEDYISHTDGSRNLFEQAYQFVKQISLKRKRKLLNSLKKTKGAVLDIGAGTGDFLSAMQADGWEVSGTEPNPRASHLAQEKGVQLGTSTSDFLENSFDVVTLWHVLEHVADLNAQISELKRLVKDNGFLIIAVPNFRSYDAKYYSEFWAAYDTPRHLYHFSAKSIQLLFEEAGFTLQRTLPLKFDAYYVSLLSEKYKAGKRNFLKAMLTGLRSNWAANTSGEYSSLIYVLRNAQNAK